MIPGLMKEFIGRAIRSGLFGFIARGFRLGRRTRFGEDNLVVGNVYGHGEYRLVVLGRKEQQMDGDSIIVKAQ